jgi:uncharacterized RDD family membrane protein YckC
VAEVVTGEAVVLDLAVARFPSRIAALLLDLLVEIPVLIFVQVVVFEKAAQHLNTASAAAIELVGYVAIVVSYPTIFETLTRGKSLGKMALGIRVVSDDGGPVRFRQALIRALAGAFIEIWPPISVIGGGPAGLVTSMISAKGKRLGDMFAGTFVIQERVPRRPDLPAFFMTVPPPLVAWAEHVELSRLSDQTAAAASSYLRRFYDLREPAREQLGLQLATAVAAQVSPPPPPGTPSAAYLAAVLAVRRQREMTRLIMRPGPPGVTPDSAAQAGSAPGAYAGQGWPATTLAATSAPPAAAADGHADDVREPTRPQRTSLPEDQGSPEDYGSPDNFGFAAPK